jgi:hypothetical protein
MSINILVGSDPDDIRRIVDTIAALQFLHSVIPEHQSLMDLEGASFNADKVEYLIDWYKSMKDVILYAGNTEDVVLEPNLV